MKSTFDITTGLRKKQFNRSEEIQFNQEISNKVMINKSYINIISSLITYN